MYNRLVTITSNVSTVTHLRLNITTGIDSETQL